MNDATNSTVSPEAYQPESGGLNSEDSRRKSPSSALARTGNMESISRATKTAAPPRIRPAMNLERFSLLESPAVHPMCEGE